MLPTAGNYNSKQTFISLDLTRTTTKIETKIPHRNRKIEPKSREHKQNKFHRMIAAVSSTFTSLCIRRFSSYAVVLVLVLVCWDSVSSLHGVAAASINTAVEEESLQQHQSHRQLDSAFTKPPTDPPTLQPTPVPTRQPVTPTKRRTYHK